MLLFQDVSVKSLTRFKFSLMAFVFVLRQIDFTVPFLFLHQEDLKLLQIFQNEKTILRTEIHELERQKLQGTKHANKCLFNYIVKC